MPTTNHHKEKPIAKNLAQGSGPLSETVEKTKRISAFMEEKADQAAKAVGAGMESLGEAVQQHIPATGVLHDAADAVAAKLESGGGYLEANGLKGVGEDVTNLIRRNPVPALLIGVGVGILLARFFQRS
jgi:phage-related tail protein